MNILLRGGQVHSTKQQGFILADLRIQDDFIHEIAPYLNSEEGEKVIDCTGKHIIPGLIDSHVHFREPGATHKEDFVSGSKAAAAGGVTTILDMPNNNPPTTTPQRLADKKKLAMKSIVNYGFHILGCIENKDTVGKFSGISGVKVYLGSSTGNYLTDDLGVFTDILQNAQHPVIVHAENEQLINYYGEKHKESKLHHAMRDNVCAAVSIAETVTIANYMKKRIHVAHMSTKQEVDFLRKNKTSYITSEVCPHHLFLNQQFFCEHGTRGKMNPPLRYAEDQDALWAGIRDGIIDIIATDHAPHTVEEKSKPFESAPSGVAGVQTMLPLLLNAVNENKLSLTDVVRLCCTNPAQIFSIEKRGKLEVGYYADVTIVDMEKEGTIRNEDQYSKCGWTPFDGMKIRGWPTTTIVNGIIVFDDDGVSETNVGNDVFGEKGEECTFLGKKISGPFTIPSGIIMTDLAIVERLARDIPEVGVITLKSVGPQLKLGHREPVYAQYAPGSFVNAVGLTNPGIDELVEKLKKLNLPDDKFLLVSIFAGPVEDFVALAQKVAPYCDGIELNLSCPNVEKSHMAMGQDPDFVQRVVSAVKEAVDVPVIPKLTPNVYDIGEIAKAAVAGGADAITAINTVGPGYHTMEGNPVLTNRVGGMSGTAILPIGLKCVRDIRSAVDVPIIGMGGMGTADDVRNYQDAGATIYGIGSALTHMDTPELQEYFSVLGEDMKKGTNNARSLVKERPMEYMKYTLVENKKLADDFSVLVFDGKFDLKAGQFVFIWIPGEGEKPFSVLDDNPLTLAVLKRGIFTEKLVNLNAGQEVYFRGPYGRPVEIEPGAKLILVCGGTGFAGVHDIAHAFPGAELFVGARDKDHLYYLEEAGEVATVHVSTDDGSEGYHGFITELLKQKLPEWRDEKLVFYNCGPPAMIQVAVEIEKEFTTAENIYNSVDYVTKCGVGVCGSCASPDGKRACVDGPFLTRD